MRGKGFEVLSVRELTAEDVKGLKRAKLPAFKKLRNAHHRLALLLATGMPHTQVGDLVGYSQTRLSTLLADPAFQNLVETKRGLIEAQSIDQIGEFNRRILTNGLMAEELIAERLEAAIEGETEDEIPWAVLLKASRDAADRVGLAKRSVAVNVNVDFASRLDKAIQRSRMKVIESSAVSSAGAAAGPGQGPAPNPRPPAPVLVHASGLNSLDHREGREVGNQSYPDAPVHEVPLMMPAAEAMPPNLVPPRPLVTRRGAA
jgi:hypothetical protein